MPLLALAQNLLDLGSRSIPALGYDQVKLYKIIRKFRVFGRGVGTRCAKGVPQCSGPLQGAIVVIVPREYRRQEPEVIKGGLNALLLPFSLRLALLCDQRGESHPVSSACEWVESQHHMEVDKYLPEEDGFRVLPVQ